MKPHPLSERSIRAFSEIRVDYFGGENACDGDRMVKLTIGSQIIELSSSAAGRLARDLNDARTNGLDIEHFHAGTGRKLK